MKKLSLFLAGILLITSSFAASTLAPKKLNANEVYIFIGKNGQKISLMDLSQMRVKQFEALSGKKLKFSEKIAFSLGQKQLRNSIKADGTINAKKMAKAVSKAKEMSEKSKKYLKLWLILLGVSIVLDIIAIAAVSPAIWILGALAGLGALVFFVLWLVALAE